MYNIDIAVHMLFRLFSLFHPYLGWRRIDSSSLSILIMLSGFELPHRRRSIPSLSGGVGWLGLRPAVVGPGGSSAWVARDGQGHVVHLWPRCGGWVPEEESHGPWPWHAEVACMWNNLSILLCTTSFFFPGGSVRFLENTIFQKSSRHWVRVPGHDTGPVIKYHTKKGPDVLSWKLPDVQWQEINFCLLWLRGGWSISLCM